MKKKIEKWIAKKLRVKPDDVILDCITVEFSYVSPMTMELTKGKKEIRLSDLT